MRLCVYLFSSGPKQTPKENLYHGFEPQKVWYKNLKHLYAPTSESNEKSKNAIQNSRQMHETIPKGRIRNVKPKKNLSKRLQILNHLTKSRQCTGPSPFSSSKTAEPRHAPGCPSPWQPRQAPSQHPRPCPCCFRRQRLCRRQR